MDQHNVVQRFPALSMLTGLIANALGWRHGDIAPLESLQENLRYAARLDRVGTALLDYQTVDLSSAWMRAETAGWTTRDRIAGRGGAKENATGTHQRYRHYRADSICTVSIGFESDSGLSPDQAAEAIREPARPLFLGRKCCLPAAPLVVDVIDTPSLLAALAVHPRHPRADEGPLPATWWEGDNAEASAGESRVVAVTDERDWRNRVHVGRRLMREGRVDPPRAQT